MNHRGWEISYSDRRPVTGRWRAERFGVGLCAGTEELLLRMIDRREDDERIARLARAEEFR